MEYKKSCIKKQVKTSNPLLDMCYCLFFTFDRVLRMIRPDVMLELNGRLEQINTLNSKQIRNRNHVCMYFMKNLFHFKFYLYTPNNHLAISHPTSRT